MTTTVMNPTLGAILSGRMPLPRTPVFYAIKTAPTLEASPIPFASIAIAPKLYVRETYTAYAVTGLRLELDSSVLFSGVTLYNATEYYLVASAYLPNLMAGDKSYQMLWHTRFTATQSISGSLFSIAYPNNTLLEI